MTNLFKRVTSVRTTGAAIVKFVKKGNRKRRDGSSYETGIGSNWVNSKDDSNRRRKKLGGLKYTGTRPIYGTADCWEEAGKVG